jgi:hypothetical protein
MWDGCEQKWIKNFVVKVQDRIFATPNKNGEFFNKII